MHAGVHSLHPDVNDIALEGNWEAAKLVIPPVAFLGEHWAVRSQDAPHMSPLANAIHRLMRAHFLPSLT